MITFDTAFSTAKKTIRSWSGYADVSEVTIIRDVLGRLSFLITSSGKPEKNSLETALQGALDHYDARHIFWTDGKHNDLTEQLLQEIQKLRHFDEKEGNCKWFFLERTIAKKAWLDYSGQVQPVWPYADATKGKQPKVITFYSFKGGMGRTTALAATALLLTRHGRHVLAIDTDVEAPGLATLFFDESQILRGTVDFYLESSANGQKPIDVSPYLKQVNDPNLTEEMKGALYIIPAGNVDDHYVQKLGRIDYQDTIPDSMRKNLDFMIKSAVNFIRGNGYPLDYILLDARAGFHDMGGIVTAHLPHGVVLFGRNNTQSWTGLKQVIQTISHTQNDLPPIAIVDSMSGNSEEQKQAFKSAAHTICIEHYYPEDDPAPGIDAEDEAHTPIYIPYIAELSEEIRLYSDGSEKQDQALNWAKEALSRAEYCVIENRIRQWFGDDREMEVTEVDKG